MTSLCFDISVLELFWTLARGFSVVIHAGTAPEIPSQIRRHKITHLQCTPSTASMMVVDEDAQKSFGLLQALMIGGEPLSTQLAERLQKFVRGRVISMYGPTETTIWSSTCSVDGEQDSISIGRPIANTRIYILDEHGEPVPVGVTGELYIAGAGVARGYLNRRELTAERFLGDPFVGDDDARMYRTGDLGRWLPDGTIEFLGRNDDQVKIRGFRVELGEIEVRLAEHEGVGEAAVVVREDTAGDKNLVAYYTCADANESSIGAETLRGHMSTKVPEYMLPAAYVMLESLPLTANGKLDRKALPSPGADAYATREYEAPVGEMETLLARLWAEVLKVERVGRNDNFFELGGHSLLAVAVITRLRQAWSVQVTLGDLFAHPVLALLSEQIIKVQLEQFDSNDLARLLKLMRGV